MLRKAGSGFTYGDAKGRELIGSKRMRWVKVSPKERRAKAARLLAAFKGLVTDKGAHGRLDGLLEHVIPVVFEEIELVGREASGAEAFFRDLHLG